jgi:hypothetical protein
MSVLPREQYAEPQINWEALRVATIVPPASRLPYAAPRRDLARAGDTEPTCSCMDFCPIDHANE